MSDKGPFRLAEFATLGGVRSQYHVAADDLEIEGGIFDSRAAAEEQCELLNLVYARAAEFAHQSPTARPSVPRSEIDQFRSVCRDLLWLAKQHDPGRHRCGYDRCELCSHTRDPCEVKSTALTALRLLRSLRHKSHRVVRTKDGLWARAGDWLYPPGGRLRLLVLPDLTVPMSVPVDGGGWRDLSASECYAGRVAASLDAGGEHG